MCSVAVGYVLLRQLCRVEEGSDQLGYVAMGYVKLRQFSRGWVFLDQLGSVEAVEVRSGQLRCVAFHYV